MRTCIRTYMRTSIRTYASTYIRTYATYIRTYASANIRIRQVMGQHGSRKMSSAQSQYGTCSTGYESGRTGSELGHAYVYTYVCLYSYTYQTVRSRSTKPAQDVMSEGMCTYIRMCASTHIRIKQVMGHHDSKMMQSQYGTCATGYESGRVYVYTYVCWYSYTYHTSYRSSRLQDDVDVYIIRSTAPGQQVMSEALFLSLSHSFTLTFTLTLTFTHTLSPSLSLSL